MGRYLQGSCGRAYIWYRNEPDGTRCYREKKSMASHVKRKGKEEEASVLSLTAGFESGEEEKWEETQVGMKEAMPSG